MKKSLFIVFATFSTLFLFGQEKSINNLPFVETSAKADTLVKPDRIYLKIVLSEADSKNKKSTEELEKTFSNVLLKYNIDTDKNLSLIDLNSSIKAYFLKGQNIIKTKMYLLLVYDAMTAGNLMTTLEEEGISNVEIEKTEYSKAEQLLLDLKTKAAEKAKQNAEYLLKPFNTKIKSVVYISDTNNNNYTNSLQGQPGAGIRIRGASTIYGNRGAEPLYVEFQKIKLEVQVNVKFSIE